MKKLFALAVALVLLCAVPPALADKPPQALFKQVTETSELVHKGLCNVVTMSKLNTPCLIFYNGAEDLMWLVLFDLNKRQEAVVSHVIHVKDEKETIVWCRQDVCV